MVHVIVQIGREHEVAYNHYLVQLGPSEKQGKDINDGRHGHDDEWMDGIDLQLYLSVGNVMMEGRDREYVVNNRGFLVDGQRYDSVRLVLFVDVQVVHVGAVCVDVGNDLIQSLFSVELIKVIP